MSARLTLQVLNNYDALQEATGALAAWLDEQRLPPESAYLATLALEELITNSIKYGYDDQHEHRIQVEMIIAGPELVMVFTDDGHPFNPLDLPAPDVNLPAEERPVGGLGIHLLRTMADKMEYAREGANNRVTLRKIINR